jgi:hypothetical protein
VWAVAIAAGLAGAAVLGFAACDDGSTTNAVAVLPCAAGQFCVSDPSPRCVVPLGQPCADTAECPPGTVCGTRATTCAGVDAGKGQCVVPSIAHPNEAALIEGFAVRSMDLAQVADASSGATAFTWTPVDGTTIVECALFVCDPVVRDRATSGSSFSEPAIVNYDQCVIAAHVFPSPNGTFDLGNTEYAYAGPSDGGTSCSQSPAARRVTRLSVGCWAYDTSRVIAASALTPVGVTQVYDYDLVLDPLCTAQQAGACQTTRAHVWGDCTSGGCAVRCVDDYDCVDPSSLLPGDAGVAAATPDAQDAADDAPTDGASDDGGADDGAAADAPPPGCPQVNAHCTGANAAAGVLGYCEFGSDAGLEGGVGDP